MIAYDSDDFEIEEAPMAQPQLLAEQCSTCIFRPGNLMHLHKGRLADVANTNRKQGTALICHQTLSYGDHPEVGEAVCRGFYDAYKDENRVIQITERILGGFEQIPPPAKT
jgi:hypothetical protein